MASKKTRVTFGGINKDISKSKFQANQYWDAQNIKLTPVEGQTFGALSNAYGNLKALEIPVPVIDVSAKTIFYGTKSLTYLNQEIDSLNTVGGAQVIIGHVQTIRGVILFTTDSNGVDCIWEVPDLDVDTLELNLLYLRDLEFSKDNLIQAIFNYENEVIQKVFWVDGENFLRFFNTKQSIANGFEQEIIDVPVTSINSKSTIDISKPYVESGGGGGIHTAGVIQYGYTLYNLNGAETSLSPLSDLFPLDKGIGQGGGDVNEVVGSMPVVIIEDVDTKYSFIKLFAVKYTSFNGTPQITTVYDGTIGNYTKFTFNDTGTHNLGDLSISEFVFLGADPIKPTHIATKDNILFAANTKVTAYKFDIDTRAYSFNKAGTSAPIYNNVTYSGVGNIPFTGTKIDVATYGYDIDEDFDCINLDFDTYRYSYVDANAPVSNVLIDKATYNASIQGEATVNVFGYYSDTIITNVNVTCNTANTNPIYYDIPFGLPGGTNNRLQITETARYSMRTYADFGKDGLSLAKSSENVYMQVFSSASSTTPILEVRAERAPLLITDAYTASANVDAGNWVKLIARVGVHYNNNVCPYQGTDNLANGSYSGDGPFVGPTEAGQTFAGTIDLEYSQYQMEKIDLADRHTPLPLTATAGEGTITGGKYVSDYVGTLDTVVNISINQAGLLQSDPDTYSLGLFKNNNIVSSQSLNLVNAGIITRTFYFNNVAININDELEIRIVNNRFDYIGAGAPSFRDDTNMTIGGTLSLTKAVSGGFNGEGGTGKYIKYELTRTVFDNLGLDLRQARFFKDNEIYRIGVIFFNRIGQASEVKWIADFKAPQGNLEGQYNTLNIEFNSDFYTYINTLSEVDRPTNYNVVRAVRNSTDRTIVSQGLLTGMFVQDAGATIDSTDTYKKRANKNSGLVKYPIPMTRGFGNGIGEDDSYYPVFPTKHNITMTARFLEDTTVNVKSDQDPRANKSPRDIVLDEIYRDREDSFRRQQSWQYTKLMQMHSPEATFRFPIITTDKDQLHLLGYMKRNEWNVLDYNIDVNTFGPHLLDKTKQFTIDQSANFYPYSTGGYGIIGPSYRTWESDEKRPEYSVGGYSTREPAKHARRMHMYKSFLPLVRPNQEIVYDIYNRPEVTEIGQSIVSYNNDPALQYTNKLTFIKSDVKQASNEGELFGGGTDAPGITTVISEGSRCITMALGGNNLVAEDRPGLDDLYSSLGTGEWDVELFGEIRKEASYVYSGAIYGGYSASSRSRTEYISIGEVVDINQPSVQINSPGDTFVQLFRNTRLTRSPGAVYDTSTQCMVETLEYLVESTVNLEERNDSSLKGWDYLVDPTAEQGTNYNRVYSTDNALITYTPDSLKIREVTEKETEIIPSKVKLPAEFVESWVDFRPDNALSLDGKYGPINGLVSHFDQLYSFQDFAVASVSVNPRVQTVGNDGVGVELGTGTVLHDYQYITTQSGSINKWSIISTNSGLYYLDANLKQINRIGKGIEGVSEAKGLHSFFQTNLDRDSLRQDNPVTGNGVTSGYDVTNGDIYFTVQHPTNEYTLAFNEKMNTFTSFYSFIPTRYFNKGEQFFTVPKTSTSAYIQGTNEFQTYYDEKFEAYVTLLINTDEPGAEKVFNNIEFDSEVTLDGLDIADQTIDSIEAWTDYQASGKIPLEMNVNLKRRFRTWRANIPRQEDSRNRLRDKWIYIKLGFNPENNYKLVLHDIIISYGT